MRKTNTPSHYAPVFCVIIRTIFLQYFSVFICAAAICQQVQHFTALAFFGGMQSWKTHELVPVSLSWFSRPCEKPDGSTSVISYLPFLSADRSVQHSPISFSVPRRPIMERDQRFISQLVFFRLPQSHLLTSDFCKLLYINVYMLAFHSHSSLYFIYQLFFKHEAFPQSFPCDVGPNQNCHVYLIAI